jgi:hypothetical protein
MLLPDGSWQKRYKNRIDRRRWMRQHYRVWRAVAVILVLALALCLVFVAGQTIEEVTADLPTEWIGAVITYVLLERWLSRPEEQEAEIRQLILEMSSTKSSTAAPAAEKLSQSEAWRGGSLRGARLGGANLAGARFFFADLRSAELSRANLSGAEFSSCDLRSANSVGADLRHAAVWDADLRAAALVGGDWRESRLCAVDLEGTDLYMVMLDGAQVSATGVTMNANTRLPDGTMWAEGRSLAEFGAQLVR